MEDLRQAEPHNIQTPVRQKLAGVMASLVVAAGLVGCSSSPEEKRAESYEYAVEAPVYTPKTFHAGEVYEGVVDSSPTLKRALKKNNDDWSYPNLMTVVRQDGELVVTNVADGVDRDKLSSLEAAVANSSSWIKAAMDDGTLKKVDFNFQDPEMDSYNPDGFMQYVEPQSGDESITDEGTLRYDLPTTGSVSAELISTMLHHEAVHAGIRNLSVIETVGNSTRTDDEVIPVDSDKYTQLCTQLRTTAVDEIGPHSYEVMDTLNEMLDDVPSKRWQRTVIDIRRALANGEYEKYQAEQGDADGLREYIVQACRVDDPGMAIYRDLNHDPLANPLLKMRDYEIEMLTPWIKSLNDESIYRVVRESTYIEGEGSKEYMGHPYDGLSELMASYLTIAMLYPEQVKQNIGALPQEQHKLLKELLQTIAADVIRAHEDEPELIEEIEAAVRNVTS